MVPIELVSGPCPSSSVLPAMLDALTRINADWLRAHPGAPTIYGGGVRYQAEPIGSEQWRTLPVVLASGYGDCEDLACARAAELIVSGVAARAQAIDTGSARVGGGSVRVIHIVVVHPEGTVEDPSARLGMPVPTQAARLLPGMRVR